MVKSNNPSPVRQPEEPKQPSGDKKTSDYGAKMKQKLAKRQATRPQPKK
jgi:hypothetical protein